MTWQVEMAAADTVFKVWPRWKKIVVDICNTKDTRISKKSFEEDDVSSLLFTRYILKNP